MSRKIHTALVAAIEAGAGTVVVPALLLRPLAAVVVVFEVEGDLIRHAYRYEDQAPPT